MSDKKTITVSMDQVNEMSSKKKSQFLKQAIKEKYDKDVEITCLQCAINLLFDNGYVSDEELAEIQTEKYEKNKDSEWKDFYKNVFK